MSIVTARREAKKVFSQFFEVIKDIDLKKIADAWGIQICPDSLENDTSGMIIVDPSATKIFVNTKELKERQTFTIGHELGHFHLHKDIGVHIDNIATIDKTITMARDYESQSGKSSIEMEANAFAAELLMPEKFLVNDVKEFPDVFERKTIQKLAKKYSVSGSAMKTRLESLKSWKLI
jgi:Zn-dependent peptidase ImmA (M78 family)